jgi:hypothetical protein
LILKLLESKESAKASQDNEGSQTSLQPGSLSNVKAADVLIEGDGNIVVVYLSHK